MVRPLVTMGMATIRRADRAMGSFASLKLRRVNRESWFDGRATSSGSSIQVHGLIQVLHQTKMGETEYLT